MRGCGLQGFLWLSTASFAWSGTKHYSRHYDEHRRAGGLVRGGCQTADKSKFTLYTVQQLAEGIETVVASSGVAAINGPLRMGVGAVVAALRGAPKISPY